MGRPDYEDSIAAGTEDGDDSSDDALVDGDNLGPLDFSRHSQSDTLLGIIQEGEDGAS